MLGSFQCPRYDIDSRVRHAYFCASICAKIRAAHSKVGDTVGIVPLCFYARGWVANKVRGKEMSHVTYKINCSGVDLNCDQLVTFIQSKNGLCTLAELRQSQEMADVAKEYAMAIHSLCPIPEAHYVWFIYVVGLLIMNYQITVCFNPF